MLNDLLLILDCLVNMYKDRYSIFNNIFNNRNCAWTYSYNAIFEKHLCTLCKWPIGDYQRLSQKSESFTSHAQDRSPRRYYRIPF